MFLVECRDTTGALFNLMPGEVFPTVVPAPSLSAVFPSLEEAHEFTKAIDPRTWDGLVLQANGNHCQLRRDTARIARLTLLLTTELEGF